MNYKEMTGGTKMIFYFSGTGNSQHVAEEIAKGAKERLVFMSESSINANEIYSMEEDEKVGFVFPVYWYALPTIVEKFIGQLKLSGYSRQYVYAVATYGIAGGNIMKELACALNKQGLPLHARYGVCMVDNYVVGYNIPNQEKQKEITDKAEVEIRSIIPMIERKETAEYIKKGMLSFITPITGYAYRTTDHTKKFYTTKACNGCGQCAAHCPCNAILIENMKPKWAGNCTFCLKCIHGCTQSAIQYGKYTEKRDRYQYTYVTR
jgi:formate hydrogenlyase subunit 6/NADH:ubiquinone oxidoreductase subunit I